MCPSFTSAINNGKPTRAKTGSTIADGWYLLEREGFGCIYACIRWSCLAVIRMFSDV